MTATFIGNFGDSTNEEWHAARADRIGGSEAAAILGLSPFESRFSLYHRKLGLVGRQEVNREMDWGTRLEPVVIAKWLENHADTHEVALQPGSYLSNSHPFMLANLDQAVVRTATGEIEVVEVKTSPFGDEWGPAGSDIYPVYYRVQCIHYGHVMGAATVHLAVLISGCDYREYTVDMTSADTQADLAIILAAEQQFINDLRSGNRPNIDEHSATYETVRALHPDIEAKEEVELDPDLANRYVTAKANLAAADNEHATARSLVMDAMGAANYATHNGERIARRQAKGEGRPFLVACKTPSTKKDVKAA
jgi:putative phage-type endonuclease